MNVDSELMIAAKAGNVEAFGELYDRYCDRAYRVAWWVCREPGRAQDAVQEAFLNVCTAGPRISRSTAVWRPGC